jgi:hypothetical protein
MITLRLGPKGRVLSQRHVTAAVDGFHGPHHLRLLLGLPPSNTLNLLPRDRKASALLRLSWQRSGCFIERVFSSVCSDKGSPFHWEVDGCPVCHVLPVLRMPRPFRLSAIDCGSVAACLAAWISATLPSLSLYLHSLPR